MYKYLLVSFLCISVLSCKKEDVKNSKLSGTVFGTSYSIIYDSEMDYQEQFDSLFYVVNKSMSTYQSDSDISKLNRNEAIDVYETTAMCHNYLPHDSCTQIIFSEGCNVSRQEALPKHSDLSPDPIFLAVCELPHRIIIYIIHIIMYRTF